MNNFLMAGIALSWLLIGVGGWLGWQLLRQNGRILLRLDELEKRLDELEFDEPSSSPAAWDQEPQASGPQPSTLNSQRGDQSLVSAAATSRFSNRSLAR